MANPARHKAVLRGRRKTLLADMSEIDAALDAPAPTDWEDRAVERQGDEVLEAMGAHDRDELRRIDAALARIEDGSYGICVKCGDEIAEARLNAVPETPFCAGCASG